MDDGKLRARRESAIQARGQMAQTKGWLAAVKMHTAIVWVVNALAGVEVKQLDREKNVHFQCTVDRPLMGPADM